MDVTKFVSFAVVDGNNLEVTKFVSFAVVQASRLRISKFVSFVVLDQTRVEVSAASRVSVRADGMGFSVYGASASSRAAVRASADPTVTGVASDTDLIVSQIGADIWRDGDPFVYTTQVGIDVWRQGEGGYDPALIASQIGIDVWRQGVEGRDPYLNVGQIGAELWRSINVSDLVVSQVGAEIWHTRSRTHTEIDHLPGDVYGRTFPRPDFGYVVQLSPRTVTVDTGAIQQRNRDGANIRLRSTTLTWSNLTTGEKDVLEHYCEDHANSEIFVWKPYLDGPDGFWIITNWNVIAITKHFFTVEITIEERVPVSEKDYSKVHFYGISWANE